MYLAYSSGFMVSSKEESPFGKAIKSARNEQKESRNKVGNEMFLSPRYLANIENKGQHPSLQIFFELVTRYHISVETPAPPKKTTRLWVSNRSASAAEACLGSDIACVI